MRIVLTGGTGFIGSHFLLHALNSGHEIRAIKRKATSRPLLNLSKQPNWICKQFTNVQSSDLRGSDVLVHLACHSTNVPYDSIENCIKSNVLDVIPLFEAAKTAGITKFILAGSCFEYGESGNDYEYIPTNAPLKPLNSYSLSKSLASLTFTQWAHENNVSLEILRIFHVFGEGELTSRFWPSLVKAAKNGEDFPMSYGEQIRDFQSVELVSKCFLNRAVKMYSEEASCNIFNLNSRNHMSLREFAEREWKKHGATGKLIFGKYSYRSGESMRLLPGPNSITI